eukprot:TRINITY_DN3813_c0_g1_i5.p1 TRINITY_DN3813_c0_g1~~TRINITY_DN3813_c0_g1_i5.p1  ORF type:complete len:107 (+),score=23.43 TRINITY_DN3813_c0_g1_i5:145-465(+)
MLRSLVGSEMCIRDRCICYRNATSEQLLDAHSDFIGDGSFDGSTSPERRETLLRHVEAREDRAKSWNAVAGVTTFKGMVSWFRGRRPVYLDSDTVEWPKSPRRSTF